MITKEEDAGLGVEQAVNLANQENYLGDSIVVEQTLRLFGQDSLSQYSAEKTEDATKKVAENAEKMADIFLGLKPDLFTSMIGWNTPGLIDKFVAGEINSTETDPKKVMAQMFIRYIADLMRISNYAAEPDTLDEQFEFQINGTVERYCNMLLGIVPDDGTGTA